ncbi:hypothetical protein GDO86_008577 [Hymenochirus boettgeri]|uniref:Reticulon n=1 Tax=Hymenochirus boettgeri TaxID=247094 RepID=A0A8T2J3I9_9PIPI|nr:hypothetical protein GDO86_008577 [Hymenochirus boettgeri]
MPFKRQGMHHSLTSIVPEAYCQTLSVEDLIDSLKLALLMWLMTYVGAVFNGITLFILGVLLAFTAPLCMRNTRYKLIVTFLWSTTR